MARVLKLKLGGARSLLILDDVHWMDSSSWKLLGVVMKEVKPLVVLLTLRPLPDELQSPEYKEVAKSAERVVKVLRLERRPSPGLDRAHQG